MVLQMPLMSVAVSFVSLTPLVIASPPRSFRLLPPTHGPALARAVGAVGAVGGGDGGGSGGDGGGETNCRLVTSKSSK